MSASFRIAVFVSGGGTNLQALIDASARGEIASRIALVLSNRADAFALERARRSGIETAVIAAEDPWAPSEAAPDGWLRLLADREIDLILLAGYLKKIPASVIDRYPGRILNIHPALLPRHGGPGYYGIRVHESVFEAGDTVSGATVHLVAERYDEGKIILQEQVDIRDCRSPQEIAQRVLELEHRLYARAVRLYENGDVFRSGQEES